MRAYDYDAVAYDGEVYCVDCLPDGVDPADSHPIFASDEWPAPGATCAHCGYTHDYMSLIGPDVRGIGRDIEGYLDWAARRLTPAEFAEDAARLYRAIFDRDPAPDEDPADAVTDAVQDGLSAEQAARVAPIIEALW